MGKKQSSPTVFKILFLGTGAADWPYGKYQGDSPKLLSGDFRGYSSILVNGKVMVDCGPTVPGALSAFDVDLSGLSDILITHTHRDHFSLQSLESIAGRSDLPGRLNLWMEEGALTKADPLAGLFTLRRLKPGNPVSVSGCSILPLPANHRVSRSLETPLHFLFSSLDKNFLYALDGAWLSTHAWKAIQNLKLEAVIWDGTIGDSPGDFRIFAHNNIPMIRMMNHTLRENGVYFESTRIILSHLARALHPEHRELVKNLKKEGMEPAHDGMVVRISQ